MQAYASIDAARFSALQRAEIAEMSPDPKPTHGMVAVSVLFNEPKLLKLAIEKMAKDYLEKVSVLFNEPKLLKLYITQLVSEQVVGFSALQRAEIAEIEDRRRRRQLSHGFSALQRAEIAEMRARRLLPVSM